MDANFLICTSENKGYKMKSHNTLLNFSNLVRKEESARRFSSYNYAIHNMGSDIATMMVWHEGMSHRGSTEIASALLRLRTLTLLLQEKNENLLFGQIDLLAKLTIGG
nr:unnamed protein product [Callosobruchus analis]